jgi:tRNA/tmRNA/rRNA uracil-C5-methylase (TrmA/RlmC/RlmD family)
MTESKRKTLEIGQILRVEIEKVAHGGHFIARHEGAVIFVRHGIPGEIVEVEITSLDKSFARGDVIAVLESSPSRVKPPCHYARPDGCGGCDFQHISYERQRELKAEVIAEQFARIAKMEIGLEVEEISGPLHWRTRFAATSNSRGELGFKSARSSNIIPISSCPVLLPEIDFPTLREVQILPQRRVEVSLSTEGERTIGQSELRSTRNEKNPPVEIIEGRSPLHYEVVADNQSLRYQVSQGSFWQSNISAPDALVGAILKFAQLRQGDHLLDLYGGVGLFAGAVLDSVGPGGRIDIVEASRSATRDAAKNFEGISHVKIHTGDVATEIKKFKRADIVLLDPPRTGAGSGTIAAIAAIEPRSIIYIACDPASLARDTGYLREHGYHLHDIRAFDLFPMTHHVECVALYRAGEVS